MIFVASTTSPRRPSANSQPRRRPRPRGASPKLRAPWPPRPPLVVPSSRPEGGQLAPHCGPRRRTRPARRRPPRPAPARRRRRRGSRPGRRRRRRGFARRDGGRFHRGFGGLQTMPVPFLTTKDEAGRRFASVYGPPDSRRRRARLSSAAAACAPATASVGRTLLCGMISGAVSSSIISRDAAAKATGVKKGVGRHRGLGRRRRGVKRAGSAGTVGVGVDGSSGFSGVALPVSPFPARAVPIGAAGFLRFRRPAALLLLFLLLGVAGGRGCRRRLRRRRLRRPRRRLRGRLRRRRLARGLRRPAAPALWCGRGDPARAALRRPQVAPARALRRAAGGAAATAPFGESAPSTSTVPPRAVSVRNASYLILHEAPATVIT